MDKTVLVTGASSGFGRSIASLLAQRGYRVYGTSRRDPAEVEGCKGVQFIQLDVRDSAAVKDAVADIVEREGRLDVVINNAGMGIGGSLELATDDEIALQMDTNFGGCVNVCRAVLAPMRRQGGGIIVNLSSIGGVMGLPYQGYYSASKFAIEGFSEALAAEVASFGIKVVMVEPGDFATGFTASRKCSKATMDSEAYGESFRRSLTIIEQEENGGLPPERLARKVVKIVESGHPRLRYVVANTEQRLSVLLKRLLPGLMFTGILRNYYKV